MPPFQRHHLQFCRVSAQIPIPLIWVISINFNQEARVSFCLRAHNTVEVTHVKRHHTKISMGRRQFWPSTFQSAPLSGFFVVCLAIVLGAVQKINDQEKEPKRRSLFFQAIHTLLSKTTQHLLSTLRGQGLVFVKCIITCVHCIELSLTSSIISHVVSCKCFLGAQMNH